MASLNSVIANIPGLAGYQAQDQINRGSETQSLQQYSGAMNLMNMIKQRQEQSQLGNQLADTFGDGTDQATTAMKAYAKLDPAGLAGVIAKQSLARNLYESEMAKYAPGGSPQPQVQPVQPQVPPQAAKARPLTMSPQEQSYLAGIKDPAEKSAFLNALLADKLGKPATFSAGDPTTNIAAQTSQTSNPAAPPTANSTTLDTPTQLNGYTRQQANMMMGSPSPQVAAIGKFLSDQFKTMDEKKFQFDMNSGLRRDLQNNQIASTQQMHNDTLDLMRQNQTGFSNIQPDGNGGFIGLNKRSGQIEKVPQADGIVGGGVISGDGLDAAAERYRLNGTLPTNLGRGSQGATNTVNILNRAAEMAKASGDSAQEAAIRQIANKEISSSLMDLTKRESQVAAFEKTFQYNLDLVSSISSQVDRTGIPVINSWINAGKRSITGDPKIASFDTAIKGAVNEYAKIVSGSMGNTQTAIGEIKKIQGLLDAAQTPEQVQSVMATMRTETQNRMRGFTEQKAQLFNNLRGTSIPHTTTPTAPSSTQSSNQPTVSNW